MKIEHTNLKGCFVIEPEVYIDQRGSFSEVYNDHDFNKLMELDISFVQDNQSVSKKNVLRGFHFQIGDYAQSKLVRVVHGSILDVCVDLRENSATYLKHFQIKLSDENKKQLFVPRGFAHGFLALSDNTIVNYKCDAIYKRSHERGIRYDDPTFAVDWPILDKDIIISDKDLNLPFFGEK
ncbi:MAG: dTDP-4-dehydrorhamnose 3,5-epimerase [bacterium]